MLEHEANPQSYPTGCYPEPMKNVIRIAVALSLLILASVGWAQAPADLNVYMMQATVKLLGVGSIGTGFLIMRPLMSQHGPQGSVTGNVVLVTAAHVLSEMQGDTATVVMRRLRDDGTWERHESRLPIRRNGAPLWTQHPNADVAVMYVMPDVVPFTGAATTDMLASDELIESFSIAPGSELKCLGYPLGQESNPAGFAILRAGVVASYPLVPTSLTKTFLMDFRVFKGNSGGPVYFSAPVVMGGGSTMGRGPQLIMGLVSQEAVFELQHNDPYERSIKELQLFLGVVIHASIIKAAIEALPRPESPAAANAFVRMTPAH